jgi:hypothetical protein
VKVSYFIRFKGIGSTSILASSAQQALLHAEMFQQHGMKDIILGEGGGNFVPLHEFLKRHRH